MFFDQNASYSRVPEPGDTGRMLLVQGDISVWEGWSPSDAFETPDWARPLAEDTQIPLDAEARAGAMLDKLKTTKAKLAGAKAELDSSLQKPKS